jgi:hypothetical protein
MGQTPSEITRNIEEARADLGSNLHVLEHKVKGMTDWRLLFQRYPLRMIGLAAGAGFLLSLLFGGRRRRC